MMVTGRSKAAASVYWLAHYLLLGLFIAFALFPLYWLLKVSVTPNNILYAEGVRMWPSATTWANYAFVLTRSDFPRFFLNSVIVDRKSVV